MFCPGTTQRETQGIGKGISLSCWWCRTLIETYDTVLTIQERSEPCIAYNWHGSFLVTVSCILLSSAQTPLSLWNSGGCYIGMGAFGRGHVKGGCELVGQVIGQLLRKHTFRVLCNVSLRHGEIDKAWRKRGDRTSWGSPHSLSGPLALSFSQLRKIRQCRSCSESHFLRDGFVCQSEWDSGIGALQLTAL